MTPSIQLWHLYLYAVVWVILFFGCWFCPELAGLDTFQTFSNPLYLLEPALCISWIIVTSVIATQNERRINLTISLGHRFDEAWGFLFKGVCLINARLARPVTRHTSLWARSHRWHVTPQNRLPRTIMHHASKVQLVRSFNVLNHQVTHPRHLVIIVKCPWWMMNRWCH